MEYEQTRKVLSRLKAVYPSHVRKLSKEERQDMLDEWALAFKYDDAEAVNEAVTKYCSVVPYLPKISDIRALMPQREQESDNYGLEDGLTLADAYIGNLRSYIAVLNGCIANVQEEIRKHPKRKDELSARLEELRGKLSAREAELARMTGA